MTQQPAAQAHEISQVAQAVSEAINGLGEINKLVEQVKERAAPKPKQKRWISQQEILLIAARAAAVIDEELNEVKKAGVMVDEDDKIKLLSALVNTGAAWLEVKRTNF